MTTAEGRKVKGGSVNPDGLYLANLAIERWYPARGSEDGSLRIDTFDLATPGVHKFGANPDISTATVPEDIWDEGGVYTGFITAAQDCEILSNDPDDTAGGSGARTIKVQGIDADGFMQNVIATMDGVNPVALGVFFRIFRMSVKEAGASEGNEGTIRSRTVAGPITMANIIPLAGQTLMAVYTIPNDFDKAHMVQVVMAVRAANAQALAASMVLQARLPNEAWLTKEFLEVHSYGGPATLDLKHPVEYPPMTDFRSRVVNVSGNNVRVSGGFDLKFTERIIPS